MRFSVKILLAAALFALAGPALAQQAEETWYAWSPKPIAMPPYGKNKPVTRLPAVIAKHKGQARWSEQVILTKRFDAKWIQAAPGDKTPTMYYGDDRAVWVVWGGQIRFTIEGQKPFVATKGFLVQAPQRVRYSLETIGNEPSLRFEVVRAGFPPVLAGDQPKPADIPGFHYMKTSTPQLPDPYDAVHRPYRDFFKDVVAADPDHGPKDHFVVADEANMVNIIRGKGVPLPPATNRGHFHVGNDEFWFILEGSCDYLIEDVGLLKADMGDVVFVPPGRFHRASWSEGGMATRLSFNVTPNLFHAFGAEAGGRQ